MLHEVIKIEAPNLTVDEYGIQHISGLWPEYISVHVSFFLENDKGRLDQTKIKLTEDHVTFYTVEGNARYEFIDERFYRQFRRARLETVEYGVYV